MGMRVRVNCAPRGIDHNSHTRLGAVRHAHGPVQVIGMDHQRDRRRRVDGIDDRDWAIDARLRGGRLCVRDAIVGAISASGR